MKIVGIGDTDLIGSKLVKKAARDRRGSVGRIARQRREHAQR
jgi:hypothetical protein